MKKLIYLFLTVLIVACSSDDSSNDIDNNNPNCEYVLNTLPVTDIEDGFATFNGVISMDSNCEFPITEQGFVYATTIQPTTANNKVNVNGTEVSKNIENLQSNTTYYVRTFLTNVLGVFYGNEVSFMTSQCDGNNLIYLDSNGVTIKACDYANAGDTGVINGVTYTVVDYGELSSMVDFGQDVTKVVTTKINSMYGMIINPNFNQDISSWDVSNVTDMEIMFYGSSFNQDISAWDVSNVSNMRAMFGDSNFNQDISSWDVSNVTNMVSMFYYSSFNQDINSWDVSNVTDMTGMFYNSYYFNRDISAWDVSNVTNMDSMFAYSYAFNQDINSWDVSNVTDMELMFYNSYYFNRDISAWDVSNVSNMRAMFQNSSFNQNISSWNVNNVTDCDGFSNSAPLTEANTPNFTNCTP